MFEEICPVSPEEHQRNVDLGLCWTEENRTIPESSFFGSSVYKSEWTGSQKLQFYELLGRKTEAKLLEIAQIMNKSLMECHFFLQELHKEYPKKRIILGYPEIPPAKEDVEKTRYDCSGTDDHECDHTCFFNCPFLRTLGGKKISSIAREELYDIMKTKITEWVQLIRRSVNVEAPKINESIVQSVMFQFPEEFQPYIRLPSDPLPNASHTDTDPNPESAHEPEPYTLSKLNSNSLVVPERTSDKTPPILNNLDLYKEEEEFLEAYDKMRDSSRKCRSFLRNRPRELKMFMKSVV